MSVLLISLDVVAKPTADVAVSLNSNDAQIYSRAGSEWRLSETLSEVDFSDLMLIEFMVPLVQIARQTHHIHRLGTQLKPHRNSFARQERLCMATGTRSFNWPDYLETHSCLA